MNLMINNVLAINIKLSDGVNGSKNGNRNRNHEDQNDSSDDEDILFPSTEHKYNELNNHYCGYLTMLTIADKIELLDLLNNINNDSSSNSNSSIHSNYNPNIEFGSSLSPVHTSSNVLLISENQKKISNSLQLEQSLSSQTKSFTNDMKTNINNLSEKNQINNYNQKKFNQNRIQNHFQSGHQTVHPDLKELIASFDPTLSLDELSQTLERPLSEVKVI